MVSESDTDTVFLRPFFNILLSEFLIYMLIHTKFLLSQILRTTVTQQCALGFHCKLQLVNKKMQCKACEVFGVGSLVTPK